MKKILFLLASVFFMLSCSQEESILPTNENTSNSPTAAVDAQLKFAKLLSQAASDSKEVRSFLRNEALAQFDNDYDVFYPFVKNKIVSGNQKFRDILLS